MVRENPQDRIARRQAAMTDEERREHYAGAQDRVDAAQERTDERRSRSPQDEATMRKQAAQDAADLEERVYYMQGSEADTVEPADTQMRRRVAAYPEDLADGRRARTALDELDRMMQDREDAPDPEPEDEPEP
jgi:membrane-bound lytic murein transglycosylase